MHITIVILGRCLQILNKRMKFQCIINTLRQNDDQNNPVTSSMWLEFKLITPIWSGCPCYPLKYMWIMDNPPPPRTYPLLSFFHPRHIPSCNFATPDKSGGDIFGVAKRQEGICLWWQKCFGFVREGDFSIQRYMYMYLSSTVNVSNQDWNISHFKCQHQIINIVFTI